MAGQYVQPNRRDSINCQVTCSRFNSLFSTIFHQEMHHRPATAFNFFWDPIFDLLPNVESGRRPSGILKSSDPKTWQLAAQAQGSAKSEATIPALSEALNDPIARSRPSPRPWWHALGFARAWARLDADQALVGFPADDFGRFL
jgi:hypothetical protein